MERAILSSDILETPLSRRKFLLTLPSLVALASASCAGTTNNQLQSQTEKTFEIPKYTRKQLPEQIKGFSFPSWTPGEYQLPATLQSLQNLKALGVNLVGIIPTQYQDTISSTTIHSDTRTVSDQDLETVINRAHNLGFQVMLKPHLNIMKENATSWSGAIGSNFTEADWRKWFISYQQMIGHYAKIAQDNNVELFVVGNEISHSDARVNDWTQTIKEVKRLYTGALTYSAFKDNYEQINWWDQLDFIGLNPYYPLSNNANPNLAELQKAWKTLTTSIEKTSKKWNKPVLFTELGYPSAKQAAMTPYLDEIITNPAYAVDIDLQDKCIQAFYDATADSTWSKGVIWWYWNTNPTTGGMQDKNYTPYLKFAHITIAKYNSTH